MNQQFRCQGMNFRNARAGTEACPYESLYQVRFAIGKRQSTVINKPINAPRGGMLSGRTASRTGQLSDTASKHTFGGWQGGHHPRCKYSSPHLEIMTLAIGDGRPTEPENDTAKPSRTNWASEFRVTSGDLGTSARHPPHKRH